MKAFVALCMLMFVAGCGSSKPSASDGKKGVSEIWGPCGKAVRVVDFEKTNGIEKGENQYQMAYSYNLEFIDDVAVKNGVMSGWDQQKETLGKYCDAGINIQTKTGLLFIRLLEPFVPEGGISDGKVPKGTKIAHEGSAVFIKTDNGWQMQW